MPGLKSLFSRSTTKVAIYARVSTDTQIGELKNALGEDVKRQDLEVQVLKLKEFASNRGYEVIRIYRDRASGLDPNRKQLEEMMKAAFRHEFDAILIVRLDRITRSLTNLLDLMGQLDEAGVNLIATDQNIVLDSPTGKLTIHLLGAFAEWEREIISERVRDGMDKAKAKGTKSGNPIGRPPQLTPRLNQSRQGSF